ncbi:MAG: BREX-2 system phosphatase PglZ, partial [Candidatus Hydrogenedentes bacterium]|nr:BREX-2 system phosphatase PglZ [Candidatus Hydrogenedentota bacterium]
FATQGNCPAAPGGFLDRETIWAFLLERALGLSVARPDLPAILKWSLNPINVQQFRELNDEFREAAVEWLVQVADPAARIVLQCVQDNASPNALAVGLAAHVVFHPRTQGKLDKAAGKMEEKCFGGKNAAENILLRWSAAALDVVRLQVAEEGQCEQQLQRADEILKEVQADQFAYLSDVSFLGFDQRLGRFAAVLKKVVDGELDHNVEGYAESIFKHDLANSEMRRLERVTMAMRLARWLKKYVAEGNDTPKSFQEAVKSYAETGGFVDWARQALRNGDAVATLSEAYMALFKKCRGIQEKQAKVFAELFKDWTSAGSKEQAVIPVEQILTKVVAPLAAKKPVLLIVMDGMSMAVFNQLIEDIMQHDWTLISEKDQALIGITMIPSLTEFSRTSLLCGNIKQGNSETERIAFSKQPDLLAQSKTGKAPVLFHKTDLHDPEDGGLSPEIRAAIKSKEQAVVGVVINAIDDYLLKGDQIDIRWVCDEIKALSPLLYEAKHARRAVILLSDHGHILEFSTRHCPGEGGDRWRKGNDTPTEMELAIQGKRVLVKGNAVVVPWSETLRYAMKKNGYHGGVNPQEVLVPIAVLAEGNIFPEGWSELIHVKPIWWEEGIQDIKNAANPAAPQEKESIPLPDSLFDWNEDAEKKEALTDKTEQPQWIKSLMSSPVFKEQKLLAGRSFQKNSAVFIRILSTLECNGGKMTATAIAHSIGYPPNRLSGLLAIIQRVLNIDGYEVLGRDENSNTVELNLDLLRKQFEIG